MKLTKFLSTKNGIIEPNLEQIEKWKHNGLVVKHIWLDNAIENRKLQEQIEIKDWKMNIDFEYIAWYTPHQNYLAELGFLLLANKKR